MKFEKYDVYYIGRKGKEKVYHSKCSLCIDGAEEAARLDCKDLKQITRIVRVKD